MINILLRTSINRKATLLLTNKRGFAIAPILKDCSVVSPPIRNSISTSGQKIDIELQERSSIFTRTLFYFIEEVSKRYQNRTQFKHNGLSIKQDMKKAAQILQGKGMLNQLKEIVSFVQAFKTFSLNGLEDLNLLNNAYDQINEFIEQSTIKDRISQLKAEEWINQSIQTKIRLIYVLQYMDCSYQAYLKQLPSLIEHFKRSQMLALMYQKWKYQMNFEYQLLTQIFKNQSFSLQENFWFNWIKLKFINSTRGIVCPFQEGIYSRCFNLLNDRPQLIEKSFFFKMLQMAHSQNFYIQSEVSSRQNTQFNLNSSILLLKKKGIIDLFTAQEIILIYLEYSQLGQVGEIMFEQILQKIQQINIDASSINLYQRLMRTILKRCVPILTYENRIFFVNQLTNKTLSMFQMIGPRVLMLRPEITLLFADLLSILQSYEQFGIFQSLMTNFRVYMQDFSLKLKDNLPLASHKQNCIDILYFLYSVKQIGIQMNYQNVCNYIISYFSQAPSLTEQDLKLLYYTLKVSNDTSQQFLNKLNNIWCRLLQPELKQIVAANSEVDIVLSLDENIMWMGLCLNQLSIRGITFGKEEMINFINSQLIYLINTLQYLQVYEILSFTLQYQGIKTLVYQRLLYNLSNFIVMVEGSSTRRFLNTKYLPYYQKICRLVLQNFDKIKKIENKHAFRNFQLLYKHDMFAYTNQDLLRLIIMIQNPNFIIYSIKKHLKTIQFSTEELSSLISYPELKLYKYYNDSLSKSDKLQGYTSIKQVLLNNQLSPDEIKNYFKNPEVYKAILYDSNLQIKVNIPAPESKHVQLYFICLKIYYRLKMFTSYDFKPHMSIDSGEGSFIEFDLQQEKRMFIALNLTNFNPNNEFRLNRRDIPKYLKIQYWKSLIPLKGQIYKGIKAKDLTLPLENISCILKAGFTNKTSEFRSFLEALESDCQDLEKVFKDESIFYHREGCMMQIFRDKEKDKYLMTILCASNVNYKIIYICAHFLSRNGNYLVFRHGQNAKQLAEVIKKSTFRHHRKIYKHHNHHDKKGSSHTLPLENLKNGQN